MTTTEEEYLSKYESTLHERLAKYLIDRHAIDNILPDAPDILDRWEGICMSYLHDGVREFANYPTVSLGWMMFIGMAVARFWDEDWEMYSRFDDLYTLLRDRRGYDNMDDYVCQEVLKLNPEQEQRVSQSVADTAQLAHRLLIREGFEPGTPMAFNAYVRTLHQLYYFGAAVELNSLGYHMTRLS